LHRFHRDAAAMAASTSIEQELFNVFTFYTLHGK
jgi:hypothetical protein